MLLTEIQLLIARLISALHGSGFSFGATISWIPRPPRSRPEYKGAMADGTNALQMVHASDADSPALRNWASARLKELRDNKSDVKETLYAGIQDQV